MCSKFLSMADFGPDFSHVDSAQKNRHKKAPSAFQVLHKKSALRADILQMDHDSSPFKDPGIFIYLVIYLLICLYIYIHIYMYYM